MCGHSAPRTFAIVNSLVPRDRKYFVTQILGDLQYTRLRYFVNLLVGPLLGVGLSSYGQSCSRRQTDRERETDRQRQRAYDIKSVQIRLSTLGLSTKLGYYFVDVRRT